MSADQASVEQPRRIVDSSTDFAIITTDLAGIVTSWNAGAQKLLGYSEEEIVGQTADVIFTPEDRAAGAPGAERRHALQEGRAEDERWHMRQDGSRFWGSGLQMTLKDEAGAVIGFLKIMRDHTPQHEREEALHSATQGLRLAMGAGRMAVWDVDLVKDELSASPELKRLFGFPEDEPLDVNTVRACYCPGELERLRGVLQQGLARGETSFETDLHFIRPDGGHRWFVLRCEVLLDEEGKPARAVGVVFDETERRQAEAQVQASAAELRALADALPLLVSFIDKNERYVLVNQTYERWFERSREEILGRTMQEVLGDEAYAVRKSQVEAALQGEQVRFEAFTPTVGGGRRDTELHLSAQAGCQRGR
jgi:PAS domain S-box-containing protein